MRITVADFGVGNLHSIRRALEAQGARVEVTPSVAGLLQAPALVLPGVANFSRAAKAFEDIRVPLRQRLEGGLPTLGICAGMQLLFEASEEGPGGGLGYFKGTIRRLHGPRVPHMGWDPLEGEQGPLFEGIEGHSHFYFAHSFAPPATTADAIALGRTPEPFAAAVARGNVFGVQFHPEKSHRAGWQLIRNFVALAEEVG